MAVFKKSWRNYLPILDFYLEIPFISISTRVLCENNADRTIEYLMLYWSIGKRWGGEIRLYDTWRRRHNR